MLGTLLNSATMAAWFQKQKRHKVLEDTDVSREYIILEVPVVRISIFVLSTAKWAELLFFEFSAYGWRFWRPSGGCYGTSADRRNSVSGPPFAPVPFILEDTDSELFWTF